VSSTTSSTAAAHLLQERGQQVGGRGAVGDPRRQPPSGGVGELQERRERSRREQRIASAPQGCDLGVLFAERAQERGLADPGLAGNEHERTGSGRTHAPERILERSQLLRTLEQLAHGTSLPLGRPRCVSLHLDWPD
jgi:hypothetical protein